MSESKTVPRILEFNDRRGGLIGFGILLIVLGCFCALFVPLMLFGQAITSARTGAPTDYRTLALIIPMYVGLAAVFISLGIGSIKARRWARALALIIAWTWLLSGIVGIAVMGFLLPKLLAGQMPNGQSLPEAARQIMAAVTLAFMVVIYLILPGLLVLFYGSRHVKATCEARDPVTRWTDACPLPVLALSLVLGLGAVSMASVFTIYRTAVPFFGDFVTGVPGIGILLVSVALWAYCAWSIYRVRTAGWWTALAFIVLATASWTLTLARHGLLEMYQLMGYPQEQLAQMQRTGLLDGPWMPALMAAGPLVMTGYLLWVRKFFR